MAKKVTSHATVSGVAAEKIKLNFKTAVYGFLDSVGIEKGSPARLRSAQLINSVVVDLANKGRANPEHIADLKTLIAANYSGSLNGAMGRIEKYAKENAENIKEYIGPNSLLL